MPVLRRPHQVEHDQLWQPVAQPLQGSLHRSSLGRAKAGAGARVMFLRPRCGTVTSAAICSEDWSPLGRGLRAMQLAGRLAALDGLRG